MKKIKQILGVVAVFLLVVGWMLFTNTTGKRIDKLRNDRRQ